MIRLIGVRLSKLVSGGTQLDLFDNSATLSPLYQAMDRIRIKHGLYALQPASVLEQARSKTMMEYQQYKTRKKHYGK
jgi:DNA polymerase-4